MIIILNNYRIYEFNVDENISVSDETISQSRNFLLYIYHIRINYILNLSKIL